MNIFTNHVSDYHCAVIEKNTAFDPYLRKQKIKKIKSFPSGSHR